MKHATEIELSLTPEELATLFCEMGSDEQARFFNACAERSSDWFPMQLQYLTDDDGLTLKGRAVMQAIGMYSHWGVLADKKAEMRRWLRTLDYVGCSQCGREYPPRYEGDTGYKLAPGEVRQVRIRVEEV